MKVSTVRLHNVKSVVESGPIELSPSVNVVLGHNNAGKSILINALYLLQSDSLSSADARVGVADSSIELTIVDAAPELKPVWPTESVESATLKATLVSSGNHTFNRALSFNQVNSIGYMFPAFEPQNVVYPFLAKRKVVTYDEQVTSQKTNQVAPNFTHLISKVDRLTGTKHPRFREFSDACEAIIGFTVDTLQSQGGHRIGFPVGNTGGVTLETMGEGVPHLLALIADLCMAERKIFLLEEPENDLHPSRHAMRVQ